MSYQGIIMAREVTYIDAAVALVVNMPGPTLPEQMNASPAAIWSSEMQPGGRLRARYRFG